MGTITDENMGIKETLRLGIITLIRYKLTDYPILNENYPYCIVIIHLQQLPTLTPFYSYS